MFDVTLILQTEEEGLTKQLISSQPWFSARALRMTGIVTFIGIMMVNAMGFIDHDTKSGMGCGANWPLCNGAVVPTFSNEAVIIEYVHRLLTLAFVVALVIFLIGALRKRRESVTWNRMAVGLVTLLLVETAICTAGVLWNVPGSIMAWLAPIGLAAQGILLAMVLWLAEHKQSVRLMGNIKHHPLISAVLLLTIFYLYEGAWLSYVPPTHLMTATYQVSGSVLALLTIIWVSYQVRQGTGLGYGLWPLVAAPFISRFTAQTVAGDLAIYLWLSWITGAIAYYIIQGDGGLERHGLNPQPSAMASKTHGP